MKITKNTMQIEIKFCFISIFFSLFLNLAASQQNTVRPDYANKLQNLLESQQQLDCQQFDADLIECFAYNLFLKNAALFRELDNENVLVKPVLTKHFENKTVNKGDNVTLTCETQIDALPVFLFYKLNRTILAEYTKNKNSNSLLAKHTFSLQERSTWDTNDYKSIDPDHIRIERRVHSIDANKDNLADLETVHLRILNAVHSDSGYYLCIVANSIKSFRVTYSFVNVVGHHHTTTSSSSDPFSYLSIDYGDFLLSDETKLNWPLGQNNLFIGFFVAIVLFIIFVFMFICYCCLQFNQQATTKFSHKPELTIKNTKKDFSSSINVGTNHAVVVTTVTDEINNSSKMNNLIEKTVNSMKNNFIYAPMSTSTSVDRVDMESGEAFSCKLNEIKLNCSNEFSLDLDEIEFSREKLKLGRLISEGTFDRVYLADAYGIIPGRYKSVVSVKALKENATKKELESFIKEMETMRMVGRHENIISLLGCCSKKTGPLYAIIEHAKFGNLRSYLKAHRPNDYTLYSSIEYDSENEEDLSIDDENDDESPEENKQAFKSILKLQKQLNTFKTNNKLHSNNSNKFSAIHSPCLSFTSTNHVNRSSNASISLMTDLVRFCTQISNGMKYLHSKNVCHRDLASRNILLNEFKIAKIADYGLARDLQLNCYYKTKSESAVKWLAPEVLFDGAVFQNSCQWSFGVLMWEIFTFGGNPYSSVPIEDLFDYLKEGNRLQKPASCDDELYELILDCWQFKPEMRPSFSNINDRLNNILDKYERKKLEQATTSTTPIKLLETPSRINLSKKIMSRQSESEDSQYFSGTDSSLVYADSFGHSSNSSSCNFSTMSPTMSCYSNNYLVLPSKNAAAVRAATLMAASLSAAPPSPPPLKPLSRLLNVASAAYDL